MSKSKKIISKRSKSTRKNNSTMKKCKSFCKNDYKPEMEKLDKKRAQEENYSSLIMKHIADAKKKISKIYPKVCQKIYCNEDCKEGYDFNGDTVFEKMFRKELNNGFVSSYSASEIKMLKKKGALSGCSKVGKYYKYGYNVFHK